MAQGPLGLALQHIRKLAGRQQEAGVSDGQLLSRFAARQEEPAFAELMARHGPLVLGVCRRVLHDEHAAEDAFQATFLVLVRRARALAHQDTVAAWLYTVAYHMALRVRARQARERSREQEAHDMIQRGTDPAQAPDFDVRPILDAELQRLPEKYRAPVVLCYLEGKTNDEAAATLGWTRGTVAGRLSRARDLLRDRLARRGVTLAVGGLAAAVTQAGASAAVPRTLALSTGQAALAIATQHVIAAPLAELVEETLAVFRLERWRRAALALAVATLVGLGSTVAVWQWHGAAVQTPASAPVTGPVYLVDLTESRLSVPGPEHFGKGGTVKGVTSSRILSLHPPSSGVSSVSYQLDRKYATFQAAVGIRDHGHGRRQTPLTFVVIGDGQEVWKSGPVHEPGITQECSIDIRGVDQLELQVRCPGPSVYAWAAWVDPRVNQ